jgi:hypothetical protein
MDKQQQLAKIAELQSLFARARENPDAWMAGMRALDKWEIEVSRAPGEAQQIDQGEPATGNENGVAERTWLHDAANF